MDVVMREGNSHFQRYNHLVREIMLGKKVGSSAMLPLHPRPKFCPQGQSGQSEVETDVGSM